MNQEGNELLLMTPAESDAAIQRFLEVPRLSEGIALPIEPGHVMSRERYRQLVEEQQK